MKRQKDLRKRVFFWTDEWVWWLSDPANKIVCWILGHMPIADQCRKPDHDFCAYCRKSMPGKAES